MKVSNNVEKYEIEVTKMCQKKPTYSYSVYMFEHCEAMVTTKQSKQLHCFCSVAVISFQILNNAKTNVIVLDSHVKSARGFRPQKMLNLLSSCSNSLNVPLPLSRTISKR